MSALPFDQDHSESISECLRLASLEDLGRESARRCAVFADMALVAKERARTSDDLLVIAAAAEAAADAAFWCSRSASAANSFLGQADVAEVKQCFDLARQAEACAALATTRWQLMRRVHGGAHA